MDAAGKVAQERALVTLLATRARIAYSPRRRARGRGTCMTSFRWHHRLPSAIRDRSRTLAAIVEAVEMYRLESQKDSHKQVRRPGKRSGVAKKRGINREHDYLLVARDHSGGTLDFLTGPGQMTVVQLHASSRCCRPTCCSSSSGYKSLTQPLQKLADTASWGASRYLMEVSGILCAEVGLKNLSTVHS